MKALTLHQPWATLVAIGAKRVETRSWYTPYRGELAIHASKTFPPEAVLLFWEPEFYGVLRRAGYHNPQDLPLGAVIATCMLTRCVPTTREPVGPELQHRSEDMFGDRPNTAHLKRLALLDGLSEQEQLFGDFSPGRYAWFLSDIIQLEPVPARGYQQLWEWLPLLGTSEPGVRV
ncbi:MAG: ASCH domain-containing protein [Chloroflexota bacterium]|nr:ASCH domain-containing protein [Chloroflexota bacterium]